MKNLSLYLPAPWFKKTQGFAMNANASYARDGLIGHTSFDWGIPWGAPIYNCAEGAYCYSVLNRDNPDPMKYPAVFTLMNADNGVSEWAEVSYGHLNSISAEVGKIYQPGDILGTCGNKGTVFSGNHEVSRAEKLAGKHDGAHLHGPQVRPVIRVKKQTAGKQYLFDGSGVFKKDGYYFEVVNYSNGTNGCVSPEPFFNGKLATEYTNTIASLKTQVSLLGQVLALYKRLKGTS